MSLTFHCPTCRQPLPVSPGMLGQKVTCGVCQASFVLTPTHLQSPAGAARSEAPVATKAKAAATATLPLPAIAEPPRVVAPPPVPPPSAARNQLPATKPAATAPPATLLKTAPDGKLPALSLENDVAPRDKDPASQGPSTIIVVATVALSMTLSLAMLMLDFESTARPAADPYFARLELQRFFGDETAPLKPYQKLLRESQRAHSRGDLAAERKCYRKVLELLRAETRGPLQTLTGTAGDDALLEEKLTILMRDVGETSLFP